MRFRWLGVLVRSGESRTDAGSFLTLAPPSDVPASDPSSSIRGSVAASAEPKAAVASWCTSSSESEGKTMLQNCGDGGVGL